MIERFADGGVSLTELAEYFPLSFAAILQHVQVLERCGLFRTEKVGRVRVCRLDADTLVLAEDWIRHTLWAVHRRSLGYMPHDWAWHGFEPPEGG